MDTLGPALESLLATVQATLTECSWPVGQASLAPGNTVSWDTCCESGGGQLWVRVISVVPRPQPSQPCDITDLQARIGVGVVRCMHGLDDDSRAPTAAELIGDTLTMTRDADAMLRAIRAWPGTQFALKKTLNVEQGLPLGPSGYCGGWEWTLVFRLLMCGGC